MYILLVSLRHIHRASNPGSVVRLQINVYVTGIIFVNIKYFTCLPIFHLLQICVT